MDFTFIFGLITALVALYGAGLSTYMLVINRSDKKRLIKVKIKEGLMTIFDQQSEWMLFLSATNPGNRTVQLVQPFFELPNDSTVNFLQPQGSVTFPFALEEGRSCDSWFPEKELAQKLHNSGFTGKIKIRACYRDAVDNVYKSKWRNFDIEQWTQSD